jgi:hypothetical protein
MPLEACEMFGTDETRERADGGDGFWNLPSMQTPVAGKTSFRCATAIDRRLAVTWVARAARRTPPPAMRRAFATEQGAEVMVTDRRQRPAARALRSQPGAVQDARAAIDAGLAVGVPIAGVLLDA